MKKLTYLTIICLACWISAGCKTAKPVAVTTIPASARAFPNPIAAPLRAAPLPGTKNLTFAWDAVPDAAVVGYRFYQGNAPRNYNISTNTLGKVLTNTVTIGSGTFYFAVRAFDTNGILSDFSNEISYTWTYVPPITNTIITLRLVTDQASTMTGPWIAAFTNEITTSNLQSYFRVRWDQ